MVTEGAAELDGERLEPFSLIVLAQATARAQRIEPGPGDAALGAAPLPPAPRLLEPRQLLEGPHRSGQRGLDRAPLSFGSATRRSSSPSPPCPRRSAILDRIRKVPLKTGVTLNVALAGPADAPPVILLHGFPESHRTWRGIAPLLEGEFRLVMPPTRLRRFRPAPEVEAYRRTCWSTIFSRSPRRWKSSGLLWSPRLGRGDRLAAACARIRGWNGWRHQRAASIVFQKSVIEDEAQRAASQYITAFRTPGFEKAAEAMGWETLFDKSFSGHVELAIIPPQERANISLTGHGRAASRPCSTGTERASSSCRPPARRADPRLGSGRLRRSRCRLGHLGMQDRRCCRPSSSASMPWSPTSPSPAFPTPAISCPGKSRRPSRRRSGRSCAAGLGLARSPRDLDSRRFSSRITRLACSIGIIDILMISAVSSSTAAGRPQRSAVRGSAA